MCAEVERLQQESQAAAQKIALGNIASQVAHDIRSPLSSLKAAAVMLRGHVAGNRDAMDALNLLQLSGQRLEGIANGLLVKHKGVDAEPQAFSIHEVIDELIGELQASPLGRNTTFKKQYHHDALYISGDKTGMARAIGNIIKNALEAMEGNSADQTRQLIVSTTCALDSSVSPQNDRVTIRITDTGPGIPADKIPLILKGGHTEGKVDGNGIGTKVVKDVVEAHHGQLQIESQVGVGTTFVVTLPLTHPVTHTDPGMTVTLPYSGTGPICVIDDEPSLREQWRLTLRGMGISANIFTCWEDFEKSDPSALPQDDMTATFIVDYHFDNSEVDGIEIIQRLKARGVKNIVLATAEYWKPAIKSAAIELGITLCPKPLPKVVLSQPVTCHPEAKPKDLPQNAAVGISVLLIDDDTVIQTTWNIMKKNLGIGVLTMHCNLEEMIAAATNPAHFDLCIIDKNIEGSTYDGARTLEYLKQNGAKTIVLASGESEDDLRKDPSLNLADGILRNKIPMSSEELAQFIQAPLQ